jgi:hypothetical protein
MDAGDVLIADATGSRSGEFVIVDAITRQIIDGPFGSLRAALQAAHTRRIGANIWREFSDARGRAFGPPIRLNLRGAECPRHT